jgi:hypothetical protein
MTNTAPTFGLGLELSDALTRLLGGRPVNGQAFRVDHDEDAPEPWAVWLDGEIIGVGEAESEALEDAIQTVREWESCR